MYRDRRPLYSELELARGSKLLVYVTSDRPGLETQIHSEVFDYFVEHLDKIGVTEKISLMLYTRGGSTIAAWSLVNLVRQYCDYLEIIVPSKCHSAGTIMCLGANSIVMTKQATLGPIDPSITTPLNPKIEGGSASSRVPVSVEAIKGYVEFAKQELNISGEDAMAEILTKLSDKVHPLVLGEVYRSRSQIQMLARQLLVNHFGDDSGSKAEEIVTFLCSDSGSHDYTINRREAKDRLGLNVEKPSPEFYQLLKKIYDNISEELKFTERYEPIRMLGGQNAVAYDLRRCLLESVEQGCYYFSSEGVLRNITINDGNGNQQTAINDQRNYEGWRHEPADQ